MGPLLTAGLNILDLGLREDYRVAVDFDDFARL